MNCRRGFTRQAVEWVGIIPLTEQNLNSKFGARKIPKPYARVWARTLHRQTAVNQIS